MRVLLDDGLQPAVSASLLHTDVAMHRLPGLDPCMCRYVSQPPRDVDVVRAFAAQL